MHFFTKTKNQGDNALTEDDLVRDVCVLRVCTVCEQCVCMCTVCVWHLKAAVAFKRRFCHKSSAAHSHGKLWLDKSNKHALANTHTHKLAHTLADTHPLKQKRK